MKEETYVIKVLGKVQGVFFRKYTHEKARELGLCGIVRNESDGSVYIEAKGTEEKIGALVDWCKSGSPDAEVRHVEYHKAHTPKTYSSFEIIR